MTELLLTVVIPVRNRAGTRFLNNYLTLRDQLLERTSFSVLYVDYGSSPDMLDFLIQHVQPGDQVFHVEADSWHKTKAANIGLEKVSTPFVMFSDVDMIYPPEFLQVVNKYLQPGKTVVTCHCDYLNPQITETLKYPVDWSAVKTNIIKRSTDTAVGACLALPTEWFKSIGGFDEAYVGWGREDYDVLYRATVLGRLNHQWISHETMYYHQWHPAADWKNDRAGKVFNIQHFEKMKEVLIRNRKR